MKIFLTALIVISVWAAVFSQTQFQGTFGLVATNKGSSIKQTTDGGYIIGGTSGTVSGASNSYITKLDAGGVTQWQKNFSLGGGSSCYSVIQTSDGGFAALGFDSTAYLARLNSSGTILWVKRYYNTSVSGAITQSSEGGFLIGGFYNSRFVFIKVTASGDIAWSKKISPTDSVTSGEVTSVIQTSDGGFAACGYNRGPLPYAKIYVFKLSASGALQWSALTGLSQQNEPRGIVQVADGGFVIGAASLVGSSVDFVLFKLSSSGAYNWSKSYGGTGQDYCYSMAKAQDNGFVLGGYSRSFPSDSAYVMYIVRTDTSGGLLWSSIGAGTSQYVNTVSGLTQTSDGGVAFTGSVNIINGSSVYVGKMNSIGTICSGFRNVQSTVTTATGISVSLAALAVTDYPLTAVTAAPFLYADISVQSICSSIGIQPVGNLIPNSFELRQNYPNPFNPSTKIKFSIPAPLSPPEGGKFGREVHLRIFDILGREVAAPVNGNLKPGNYEIDFDGSHYASGIYFYTLNVNASLPDKSGHTSSEGIYSETRKMVLMK